jgi:hypothetical protein
VVFKQQETFRGLLVPIAQDNALTQAGFEAIEYLDQQGLIKLAESLTMQS